MGCGIVAACDNLNDCDVYGVNDANDANGDVKRCESDFDHDVREVMQSGFDCVYVMSVLIFLFDAAIWKCSYHFHWNRWNRFVVLFACALLLSE